MELYQRIIKGEQEVSPILESMKLRKDGSTFFANVLISPVENEEGEVVGFIGIERDITEKKISDDKLKESEERYRILVESSPEPIVVYRDYQIVFVNPAAVSLIGANSSDELIGQHASRFVHLEDIDSLSKLLPQLFSQGSPSHVRVKRLIRLDGEVIHVEVKAVPIKLHGEVSILFLFRDITERIKVEDIMRRSEKLSVVGQLAAGVAHEIRNPLTALKGFMQLLKQKNTDYVDIMLDEIERINHIVNEFMSLAKPQALHYVESDLKTLIENVTFFMQPQALLHKTDIILKVGSNFKPFYCEPNQIKQLFMNILQNAIEAMPNGGTVEITVFTNEEGNFMIRIIDQGEGIPEDRLSRVGEPFYSLKERGTGLGLAVCHRIVEAHNGKMTIQSVINQGTTVEIELLPIESPKSN